MSSNQPDAPSPMTDNQLEHELDIFITQRKHPHDTNNAISIHQLTYSASSIESSIHSVHIAPTRAHRFFKRKHHDATPQFLTSRPQSSRLYSHHPQHTKTPQLLIHK